MSLLSVFKVTELGENEIARKKRQKFTQGRF